MKTLVSFCKLESDMVTKFEVTVEPVLSGHPWGMVK